MLTLYKETVNFITPSKAYAVSRTDIQSQPFSYKITDWAETERKT